MNLDPLITRCAAICIWPLAVMLSIGLYQLAYKIDRRLTEHEDSE